MTIFFALVMAGLVLGLGNVASAIALTSVVRAGQLPQNSLIHQGLLQSLMPVAGFVLGGLAVTNLDGPGRTVLAGLLFLGGLSQLVRARSLAAPRPDRSLGLVAAGTAMRNLLIGFALALLSVQLMIAGAVIVTAGVLGSLAAGEMWRGLRAKAEIAISVAAGMSLLLFSVALVWS